MSNTMIEIKEIHFSKTHPIRHKVMWPNKPVAYVKLSNDNLGRHYGLFVNREITSVISLFVNNNEAQFRKFATLEEFQGLGHGTMLLKKIIELVKAEKITKLWCNARVDKAKFYEKFNLKATNNLYEKGGVSYVIMERSFISED